jgi:hypothetical protein
MTLRRAGAVIARRRSTPARSKACNKECLSDHRRQIVLDGRSLESAPNPTWMGYSVGHWDGDTLVEERFGFNDRRWLDHDGHPHTEGLRMTERYRRRDFGNSELQVTIIGSHGSRVREPPEK